MTDRELLERAANASGVKWKWVTCAAFRGEVPGIRHKDSITGATYWPGWNPLEDDADALQLAVDLGLLQTKTLHHWMQLVADWSDKRAATRRAIVMAAAAMERTA